MSMLERLICPVNSSVSSTTWPATTGGRPQFEGEYTIDGGTGVYSGETGSGHVQIMWTGSNSRGKVTEIYS
jgi:hypothetical protein